MSRTTATNHFRRTVIDAALGIVFAAGSILSVPVDAALPATSPGAFDPTFNAGATVFQPTLTRDDFAMAVAAQPDGKVVIAGFGQNMEDPMSIGFAVRYNADGSPDTGFASGGTRKFGNAANGKPVLDALATPDGKILLSGDSITGTNPNAVYRPWLTRLNADGTNDASFGNQGGEVLPGCAPRAECYYKKLARQDDGKIVVLAGAYNHGYANLTGFIDRYNADGSPDASFGTNGRAPMGPAFDGFEPNYLIVDKKGRILVSGIVNDAATKLDNGVIARFTSDGKADQSFGNGGVVQKAIDGLQTDIRGFALQPDGRIVFASSTYDPKIVGAVRYLTQVGRLGADGAIDMSFGSGGLVPLGGGYGNGVKVQANGAIVYYGQGVNADKKYVPMTARLLPNGQPDATFGAGGIVLTDPTANQMTLTDVAIGDDNRLTFAGYTQRPGVNFRHSSLTRLIGTETTTSVVEFYNSNLNHYFVTADPNEASAIDTGAAGPGWTRTGFGWKSGGPARVCRFYGSPEVNASTGMRMGPNGHFYTISAEECAIVKEDAGWKFESYDFSGWPKAVDGHCAAGTVAVKRVYNNRFAVNDSNHRYTTSDAIYDQMVASGWSGEGTVFCAPQ